MKVIITKTNNLLDIHAETATLDGKHAMPISYSVDYKSISGLISSAIGLTNLENAYTGGQFENELIKLGKNLFNEIFKPLKREFEKAKRLTIYLKPSLYRIPYEIIHDGEKFIAKNIPIIKSILPESTIDSEFTFKTPLSMLIVATTTSDNNVNKDIKQEADEITNILNNGKEIRVKTVLSGKVVTRERLAQEFAQSEIVHFIGHREIKQEDNNQFGWRLADGTYFNESDIRTKLFLFFAGGCCSIIDNESGHNDSHYNFLYNFQNYIGSAFSINSKGAREFATIFYKKLIEGMKMSDAMLSARQQLSMADSTSRSIWPAFSLFTWKDISLSALREDTISIEIKKLKDAKELFGKKEYDKAILAFESLIRETENSEILKSCEAYLANILKRT